MSEGHIDSSMEDLLSLCEYERSVQNEVSKLPNSTLKTDYIKLLNTDVIFLFYLQNHIQLLCIFLVKIDWVKVRNQEI